jgi:hypothetical protein
MKKEFVTYWSSVEVNPQHKITLIQERFFYKVKDQYGAKCEIITPDDITYDNLAVFTGRKTKVTIETVD